MNKKIIAFFFAIINVTSYAQTAGTLDSTFNGTGKYTFDFGFQDNLNDVKIQPDQKIVCTGVALNTGFMGELKVIRLNPDGTPDNTFATNGIFTYLVTSETYGVESFIRNDGKIVVAGLAATTFGYYDFLLVRLNSDGSLDSTFGTNGSAVANISSRDDLTQAMTVQSDGKILISGTITDSINYYNNPSIIRFTENGTIDSTFGINGITMIPALDIDNEATSIAIQSDGKIVMAGHYSKVFTGAMDFDVLVVRVDTNGVPDATFGNNGVVKTSINGGIDDSFGIALDSAQNIFVGGFTTLPFTLTLDMVLLKYDNAGVLDPGFGNAGIVTFNNADEDVAYDLKIQADNKIVLGGGSGLGFFGPRAIAVWRYLPNGTPDNSFGTNGFVTTYIGPGFQDINTMALQADGKIVGAGKFYNTTQNDIFVLRYLNDVSSSVTELPGHNSFSVYPNPSSTAFAISGLTPGFKNEIVILNAIGQIAYSAISENSTMSIQTGKIPDGIYFVRVKTNAVVRTQKLCIKH